MKRTTINTRQSITGPHAPSEKVKAATPHLATAFGTSALHSFTDVLMRCFRTPYFDMSEAAPCPYIDGGLAASVTRAYGLWAECHAYGMCPLTHPALSETYAPPPLELRGRSRCERCASHPCAHLN